MRRSTPDLRTQNMSNQMSKPLCEHELAIYKAQAEEDARADERLCQPRNVLGFDEHGKVIFEKKTHHVLVTMRSWSAEADANGEG